MEEIKLHITHPPLFPYTHTPSLTTRPPSLTTHPPSLTTHPPTLTTHSHTCAEMSRFLCLASSSPTTLTLFTFDFSRITWIMSPRLPITLPAVKSQGGVCVCVCVCVCIGVGEHDVCAGSHYLLQPTCEVSWDEDCVFCVLQSLSSSGQSILRLRKVEHTSLGH